MKLVIHSHVVTPGRINYLQLRSQMAFVKSKELETNRLLQGGLNEQTLTRDNSCS